MRAISAAVVGALLLLPVPSANAQEAMVEGAGVKVGEGTVVHPILGIETGFISNVFYEETDPISSPVLRLLAELSIASLPPERLAADGGTSDPSQTLEFRGGLELQYEEYLSDNERVQDQRNLSGAAMVKLKLFPNAAFRFGVDDTLRRHTRPVNFESSSNANRDVNQLKLTFGWYPIGRTINTEARYENTIDRFESEDSSFANRLQHRIGLRQNWQYLPATRFYFDASQGIYGSLGEGEFMGTKVKQSSFPLRIVVGASSAFTEKTTLALHAGWAAGFYDAGPSYSSPVYGATFGVRYSPLGRATIGFEREFDDSINANYYSDYGFVGTLDQQISRVFLRAKGSLRFRTYDGVPDIVMPVAGATTREDVLLRFEADARYFFRDWIAAKAGYDVVADDTDFRTIGVTGEQDDPSYVRHEVTLSVVAAY